MDNISGIRITCLRPQTEADLYAKKAARADREAAGPQDRNGSSSSYTAHFSTASEVLPIILLLLFETTYSRVPCGYISALGSGVTCSLGSLGLSPETSQTFEGEWIQRCYFLERFV